MKLTLATVLLVSLVGCGSAGPSSEMRRALAMASTRAGVSASINEKAAMIKESLDKAVKLLNEVGQQEPVFGQPLSRATATIDTLNKAIANVFLQYRGNGTNPMGGYKSGGPRYSNSKPGYGGGMQSGGYRL